MMVKTIKEMVELESRVKEDGEAIKARDITIAGQAGRITELEAENTKLTEALKTIRDAGLEPIDPAYRELARAALEEGE